MKKLLMAVIFALVAVSANAQSAAPETNGAVTATPNQAAYRINAGDDIEVYVWGEERLQRQIRVLPDGTFSFPLVGRIEAEGKLPYEIEAVVSKGLENQYRGQVPQVTVSVSTPSGLQFSVMGRVNSPGSFTPGRYVNLLEALSLAGGPSQFADLDGISIVRKTPTGLTTIRASLGGLFKRSGAAKAVSRRAIPTIQTGDTVIVP
ncbi:MAG: polysaccharide biosynthesis/export family protein [Parasphingorhabdus sp.]|uniref:polysaccharide biosynthesis/export family protein n=1 Tax=Parasphingorhabdus sp. TaxID=2709688 RepID=UPI0032994CD1